MSKEDHLKSIYYDISHPASFSSVDKLLEAGREKYPYLLREEVEDFLASQITYTLHRKSVKKFPRNPIIASSIGEMAQADLIDYQKLAPYNSNYKYILTVVDVFSRKAFARCVKSKSGRDVSYAFEQIFKTYIPMKLQTDEGKEFLNKNVQQVLKSYRIQFFTARNENTKCAIVERFQRTLKEKLHKYFTSKGTQKYIDVLQDAISSYNNSEHRTIKMKPNDVTRENENRVFYNTFGYDSLRSMLKHGFRSTPKHKEGDRIRIQEQKRNFRKGYEQRFTDRIYTIGKRIRGLNRPLYRIKDHDNKEIKGNFYQEEVQRVKSDDLYRVRVLQERKRGRGKQYLVEYVNYPEVPPEWIPGSRLEELQ